MTSSILFVKYVYIVSSPSLSFVLYPSFCRHELLMSNLIMYVYYRTYFLSLSLSVFFYVRAYIICAFRRALFFPAFNDDPFSCSFQLHTYKRFFFDLTFSSGCLLYILYLSHAISISIYSIYYLCRRAYYNYTQQFVDYQ